MKTVKGKPITGAKPQMQPVANVRTNSTNSSSEAERLIKRPPMPFQTRQGPAMQPAGVGSNKSIPTGDGKSKNPAGLQKGSRPGISASGDRIPGGYSKVVGGQKGTSHPSKVGQVTMGTSPKRNSKFFGGRP